MKKFSNFISVQSYYLCFLVPLMAFFSLIFEDIYLWLTPIFIFFLLPILDQILPLDSNADSAKEKLEDLTLWFLSFLVIGLFYYATSIEILSIYNYLGTIITVGILTGGISSMIAHEFMHKKDPIAQIAAQVLLCYCLYPHFYIAHLFFHHPFVGTAKDPATAKKNEIIYHFIPRSIINSLRMSWQFEHQRLEQKKARFDRRIFYGVGIIFIAISVWLLGGISGLIIYFGQSAIAIFDLEAVNYIEHYGLSRELETGKTQVLKGKHSWNSRHYFSSRILLNIPRHSDHHLHPGRSFAQLQHYDGNLEYPFGYPAMILIALIPLVWRKIVHPLQDNDEFKTCSSSIDLIGNLK